MTFTEQWFGEASQHALGELVRATEGVQGDIIEIGSWQGRSTVALAAAAHPQVVHAVDTWEGSPGELSAELAAERDVYAEFQSNIAGIDNICVHRTGWRPFFAQRSDRIRFLFIDAAHTYDEVRDNILTALPLMVAGGIICGDDVHHPPIQRAVLDTLGNTHITATLWWQEVQ